MSEKKPYWPFYVGDWRKDPGVQSLDYETRGIWHEILCIMWESDERRKLVLNGGPMPEEALANVLGVPLAKAKQTLSKLLARGVAKREQNSGKIFCKRMVKDEVKRLAKEELTAQRSSAGRRGGLAKAKQMASKALAKPCHSSYSLSISPSSKDSTTQLPTTTQPPSQQRTSRADCLIYGSLSHRP
ncbi:YdaU family protein [Acidobacteria bacterium AH-259-A15]|nr:YdaU family protein [Acidobacteria bacterium AH-259-A15]